MMTNPFNNDDWLVVKGQENDLPLVMRLRPSIPSDDTRSTYQHLAIITWPYEPKKNGFPSPATHAHLQRAESHLDELLEAPGIGVQAASLTGNGAREWRYYAADRTAFTSKLQIALASYSDYSISVDWHEDAEWEALAELLESIEDGA